MQNKLKTNAKDKKLLELNLAEKESELLNVKKEF